VDAGFARAVIAGSGACEEFVEVIRKLGADSVKLAADRLLVDLRGVEAVFTFTEQMVIGRAVGVNLRHISRHAAIARPERITRVGEKSAQHEGATVRVFGSEDEAVAWLQA
jgi:uncharacterized protein (DUF2384 family)